MRTFGALLAVTIAGCAVPSPTSLAPAATVVSVPAAGVSRTATAGAVAADPAGAPTNSAAALTAASSQLTASAAPVKSGSTSGQAGATAAMPPVPRCAADMKQALQVLASGFKTADGKPFNIFDAADPPSSAVTTADPALQAPAASSGYSTQALPETTQGQADEEAYAWAPDAKQIWVGWGYWGRWAPLSMFGQARHVYYSIAKERLLYLDYDFFRMEKTKWESGNIIMMFAGQYISKVLDEARGRFPYTGWMAFNQARQSGYDYYARTNADIKAICIEPIFLGPRWIFFDTVNAPALIVNADSGEVTDSGWVLDIIRTISFLSP